MISLMEFCLLRPTTLMQRRDQRKFIALINYTGTSSTRQNTFVSTSDAFGRIEKTVYNADDF